MILQIQIRTVLIVMISFILSFIQVPVSSVRADEGIASHLMCPCECEMILSTCDCPSAIIVRNEITSMTDHGFSEKQIISALVKEYGNVIIPERKDTTTLLAGSIILLVVLVLVGYFAASKPDPYVIPDSEKYRKQFDEEYLRFVEMEEK